MSEGIKHVLMVAIIATVPSAFADDKISLHLECQGDGECEVMSFADGQGVMPLLKKPAMQIGKNEVVEAYRFTGQFGEEAFSLTLNEDAKKAFESLTEANIKKQMAIVVDGKIMTAPIINEPIREGRFQLTGHAAGGTTLVEKVPWLREIVKGGEQHEKVVRNASLATYAILGFLILVGAISFTFLRRKREHVGS